jgi:hypothetical protein
MQVPNARFLNEVQEDVVIKHVWRSFSYSVLLVALLSSAASAQTVSWRQLVGIIPAGNVVGSGTGTITGGFLPWTATAGFARVNLQNGEIKFTVRGLVFAGGSSSITIGTPGPVTAVKGTLICDNDGGASGGNSVLVETSSVPLSATGDASFNGSLGSLPAVCSSESDIAFVLRVSGFAGNAVEGPWIANGAVLIKGDMHRD